MWYLTAWALAAPPTIADLAWLEGTWQASGESGQMEEHWRGDLQGSMVGVSRTARNGKVVSYEWLTVHMSEGGPRLRIHFHQAPAATPAAEVWTFEAKSVKGQKVVWHNPTADEYLTYERTGTTLQIVLDKPSGTKRKQYPFTLTLAGAPAAEPARPAPQTVPPSEP